MSTMGPYCKEDTLLLRLRADPNEFEKRDREDVIQNLVEEIFNLSHANIARQVPDVDRAVPSAATHLRPHS